MASFKDLSEEVNRFLEKETALNDMDKAQPKLMEDVASEEVDGADLLLSIDHHGHTGRMKSDFVHGVGNRYRSWQDKAKRLEEQVADMLADLSSSKTPGKIDNLIAQKEQAISDIRDRHKQGRLGQLQREKQDAEAHYEQLRKKNNGKPPRKLPFWYFLVLVAIGSGEWLINYETMVIKMAVVAMAIGMTLLVAFSFAAASHFHGQALRQRVAQFGSHVDLGHRSTNRIFFIISTILFLVSFIAVVLVRYQVIQDQFAMAPSLTGLSLPGQSVGPQQSTIELLMPTVLMNLAVYLLGLVISYAVHDPIPGYQEARRDAEKARKAFKREEKKLQAEIDQKNSAHTAELDALRQTHEQNELEVHQLKQMQASLKEARKEFRNSCLRNLNHSVNLYRNTLATVVARRGLTDMKVGPRGWSMTDYLNEDISLKEGDLDVI